MEWVDFLWVAFLFVADCLIALTTLSGVFAFYDHRKRKRDRDRF